MLGNPTSQSAMKTGYSISSTGKIVAEWNHNILNPPRVVGSLSASPSTADSTFQTLTNSGFTLLGTSPRNTDAVLPYTASTYTREISFSPTLNSAYSSNYISFPATATNGYRVTFFAKLDLISSASEKMLIRFEEFNSTPASMGLVSAEGFSIDGIDYQKFVYYYKPSSSSTTSVRMYFATDINSTTVDISDFSVTKVRLNEYTTAHLFKIDDVFTGYRPGDELLYTGSTSPISKIVYRSGDAKVYPSNGKVYAPELERLSYYADCYTQSTTGIGIFSYYDKTITTNKLVLKMLNGNSSTQNNYYNNNILSYKIFTYSKSGNSWSNIYSTIGSLDESGGLEIYYNGSSWSTTEANAVINDSTSRTIDGVTDIDGVAVIIDSFGYHNGSSATAISSTVSLSDTKFDPTIRFLELSPRLQVDLSTYLQSFSVSKETDSGGLPLPVGVSTANDASIVFENIPREYDATTSFAIFSDTSNKSPLNGLITKDVKFRISHTLINNSNSDTQENIPMFVGYASEWAVSDTTATVTIFDQAKLLQDKRATDIMMLNDGASRVNLYDVVENMLQQNGFSDYNALPASMSKINLESFYVDTERTVWDVLQELMLPYMYLAYIDEYGKLSVTSYSDKALEDAVFKFTDAPISTDYISNIISMSEEGGAKPSEITVRYNTVSYKYSTDIVDNDINNNKVGVTRSKSVVWEYGQEDGLGYAPLAKTFDLSDSTIEVDNSLIDTGIYGWVSFSGYGAIGSEIIKYDGMQIDYTNTDGTSGSAIVKSSQEFRDLVAQINQSQQINANRTTTFRYTGKLMNVQRGMFGTRARKQVVFSASGGVAELTSYWASPKPVLKIQTIPAKATPSWTPTNRTVSNAFIKPVVADFDKKRYFQISGTVDGTSYGQTRMLFEGADNAAYNTYGFYISLLVDNAQAVKSEEKVGCFIKYNSTNGSGIFLEVSPGSNQSLSAAAKLYTVNSSGVYKLLGTSSFQLDKKSVNVMTKYKKKDGKFVMKNGAKVIQSTPSQWQMFEDFKFIYTADGNLRVVVNGKNLIWNSQYKQLQVGKNWTGTGIGAYAGEKSVARVHTIYATDKKAFLVSPEVSYVDLDAVIRDGKMSGVDPFYVTANPALFGMAIFDGNLQVGPAFNHEVLKTVGGYEIKDDSKTTKLFKISKDQSVVSNLAATPYKVKFAYLNVGPQIIPFKANSDSFSTVKISADTLVESDEMVITKKISNSAYNSNEQAIDLQSDWIQTEANAKKVMAKIVKGVQNSMDLYVIETFGNPLITIGDVVNLYYSQLGFNISGSTKTDHKYLVVSVNQEFDGGFSTTVKLRRISS